MLANAGRVIVQPDKPKQNVGMVAVHDKPNRWGTVVDIGAPMSDNNSPWTMAKWYLFRINPCPFKKGDKVLLPKLGTSIDELKVFWITDIPCYVRSRNK